MSNQRDRFRSRSSATRPIGGPPERKLALSGLIGRTLVTVTERQQQRSRLVNMLILAQALLTLAVIPGYVGSQTSLPIQIAVAASLIIYLAALAANRFFHRVSAAAYILVIGGSLAVAAQAVLFAIVPDPAGAARISLLFLTIILEAGLLFAPEVTLITATGTTTFTAFAILLALSQQQGMERHEAYLAIVYAIGLQAVGGLIAWLLAQFIFETTVETQRSQESQFSQARLDALNAQVAEQNRQLDENVAILQSTITRAIAGEFGAHAEIPEGSLSPLANSLNLLLGRVELATQAELMRSRIEAAALPLIDVVTRMADTGTPTPSSLPIMTNTPLDSLSVALSQMQANMLQRMSRVQRLVAEVAGALGHSHDGLNEASEAVQEAQRIAGALIAATDALLSGSQRQLGLIARARRMLVAILPAEITQMPADDDVHRGASSLDASEAAALLGLGPDIGISNRYTEEFKALRSEDANADVQAITPLTVPLPAVDPASTSATFSAETETESAGDADESAAASQPSAPQGELSPEVVEVWNLILQLDAEVASQERTISQLARDLGVLSRQVRTADASVAWFRQALDAVRSKAEQLQQIAGVTPPPPGTADALPGTPSRPLGQAGQPRGPQPTRPLSSEMRLADDGTLAELARPSLPDTPAAPGSLRGADLVSRGESSPATQNVPRDLSGSSQSNE